MLGDCELIVGVAGKRKCAVGKGEYTTAMGNLVAVYHGFGDRHRQACIPTLNFIDNHAHLLAGSIFFPHGMRAGSGEFVRISHEDRATRYCFAYFCMSL